MTFHIQGDARSRWTGAIDPCRSVVRRLRHVDPDFFIKGRQVFCLEHFAFFCHLQSQPCPIALAFVLSFSNLFRLLSPLWPLISGEFSRSPSFFSEFIMSQSLDSQNLDLFGSSGDSIFEEFPSPSKTPSPAASSSGEDHLVVRSQVARPTSCPRGVSGCGVGGGSGVTTTS